MTNEGKDIKISPAMPGEDIAVADTEHIKSNNDGLEEVFQQSEGQVDFRTVSWIRASAIFLKMLFATGILSIPSVMYDLGAVPGALNVLGWCALNTYGALVLGDFRERYPQCHTVADMAQLMGGPIFREVVGFLFVMTYVITAASGVIGVSAAFNALSLHSLCTVWFSVIATVIIALCASVRKFSHIGWLTWVGFFSILAAVFIIVIGVTTLDRPSAAPQEGPFDLGYHLVGHPTFAAGITASSTIFVSSSATSAFLPVIAEMRPPTARAYRKAVALCMSFVTASYLTFSLVLYHYCGKWVASPALGSAGPVLKRVAYGIALPGLLVSGALYVHVAAKYLFVRVLRGSPQRRRHLQANTPVHWGTWLACVVGMAAIAWVLASAIPVFTYVLALVGALGFAPLAISLPGICWLYVNVYHGRGDWDEEDGQSWHKRWTRVVLIAVHVGLVLLGLFMMVGGTYGVVVQIQEAYRDGSVDGVFSCADNSGTVS
ncbi:putative neutral amino acid permease [Aspergillus brunneoviolaceus CBS 621.78]|uniref:Uncharacterized protein n=1 Tax=Aspergillus brunneoviolaceus CBS 621.78 TaxID=1450534 RepID=A0ACD1GF56_9EURO|nr:hypothetical protein BO95DRAFT_384992 [Aspergillus brunneoviolaceus CBS 621.78]RAH47862.1 hypothetical protein BO95DRAFT_384992 [Aspergillus brunneoviolaceus CBS 621.78]